MKTDPETIGNAIADLPYVIGHIVDILIIMPLMFLLWPLITVSTWMSGRVFDPIHRRMCPLKHWFIRTDLEVDEGTVLASLCASILVAGYVVCLAVFPIQTLLSTLGGVVVAFLSGCWMAYWVDRHTESEEKK